MEHSPKKQMSSSEPILDLKTDAAEALPGEKRAGLLSWCHTCSHTVQSHALVVLVDLYLATDTQWGRVFLPVSRSLPLSAVSHAFAPNGLICS